MKTLVLNMDSINWVKHPSFPGVYIKDILTANDQMKLVNKYIKIEPQGEILVHTHDVTEAFYILEGKAKVLVNGEEILLEAKSMIAAPKDVPHGIKNENDEDIILLATFEVK